MQAFRHQMLWLTCALRGPRAQVRWRWVLAGLMLLVCVLAFDPTPRGPAVGHLDKLLHLLAFVVLSFVARWTVQADAATGQSWQSVAKLGVAMLAFGVFIEAGQSFIPARSASWGDILADGLGIVLGLGLALALQRQLPDSKEPVQD